MLNLQKSLLNKVPNIISQQFLVVFINILSLIGEHLEFSPWQACAT